MSLKLTYREVQVLYDLSVEAIEAGSDGDYETDPAIDSVADKLSEELTLRELNGES